MWTPTTRQQHSRTLTRYQTDLTDAEWHVIAPHLPKPCTTGRPREWPMREIVNGIFYVMAGGLPVATAGTGYVCSRRSQIWRRVRNRRGLWLLHPSRCRLRMPLARRYRKASGGTSR